MDVSALIREGVEDLGQYVAGEYLPGYVKLASNENNYGPSPKVVDTLKKWSEKTHLYPYRDGEVRKKLAEYAGKEEQNIVLGNGSDELIDMCVKAFRGPVAGSYPSFAEYPIVSAILGEKYVGVPLNDDFGFDAKTFLEAAKECGICFLCTPNNPTGIGIKESDIRAVIESGKLVVVDEAYYEFSKKTVVDWVDEYPNLVVLRTLAKSFALAGLRIGYAVAGEKAATALSKVKAPFNVNILAQAAAVAALNDLGYMRECVSKITKDRDRIFDAMNKRFRCWESESNFVFADVSPMSAQDFYEAMLEQKITVRKFGELEGFAGEYVRVNAGTKEETSKFIAALDSLD